MTIILTVSAVNEQDKPKQVFPIGNKLSEEVAKNFTGQAYLSSLTTMKELNAPVFNVTFEPGCRNNWHSHKEGQLLIVTVGTGYYQEKGNKARRLVAGDIVEIAPNVVHWHGASPDSWFAHLAVTCNPQTNKTTWYEAVGQKEYINATISK